MTPSSNALASAPSKIWIPEPRIIAFVPCRVVCQSEADLPSNLDADLESIPDGEISRCLVDHVVHLDGSLVHEVSCVELVIVVEADDALGHPVHVWLVWHVVGFPTVQNLTISAMNE